MSNIDSAKIIKHLQSKWKNPCPLCGAKQWNVQDKSFELREFQGGNIVLGKGLLIPVIPVICTNCGFTALINSIVVGFEPGGEEKKDE